MNVLHVTQSDIWPRRFEFHVLTYAEEGFAPLNIHARDSGFQKEKLIEFAAHVNERNETGSLFPALAISAVPRALVRELQDASALRLHIEDFFRANEQHIHSKKVLLDFRTPSVPKFVIEAIEHAAACAEAAFVEELVILDQ